MTRSRVAVIHVFSFQLSGHFVSSASITARKGGSARLTVSHTSSAATLLQDVAKCSVDC